MSSIDETTKRGLRKPQPTDYVDVVADINDNMDNLDDAVPDSRKINGHPLTADVTITKSDVGLGNVDNTADADKPISTAMSTALDGKVPVTRTVNGYPLSSNVFISKVDLGLGNVNNTSDMNKPVSYPQQEYIAYRIPYTEKGEHNGVCPLGQDAKVDDQYLHIATVAETQAMMDEYDGGDA